MDTPENKGALYSLGAFLGKGLSKALPGKGEGTSTPVKKSEFIAESLNDQYYYEQFGMPIESIGITYDDEYYYEQFGMSTAYEDSILYTGVDFSSEMGMGDDDFNSSFDHETIINIDGTPMLDGFGSVDFNGHTYCEFDHSHGYDTDSFGHDDHFSSFSDDH